MRAVPIPPATRAATPKGATSVRMSKNVVRASGSHPPTPYLEPSWYSTVKFSATARKKLEPATSPFGEKCIGVFAVVHRPGPEGIRSSRSPASVVRIPASHPCSLTEKTVGATRSTPGPSRPVKATDRAWDWARYQGRYDAVAD